MLAAILRRDQWAALVLLVLCSVTGWAYLLFFPMPMAEMDMAPLAYRPWTVSDAIVMATMWSVMMVAMMLPSATPFILLYRHVARRAGPRFELMTVAFALGYLAVWTAFSLAATALQGVLERAALMSPMTMSLAPALGAAIVAVAGLYQVSAVKTACLSHCRAPAEFLSRHWRPGAAGAFSIGVHHGLWCLGCCWGLMLLLFAAGVMNLVWVALIATYVLIEKTAPRPDLLTRFSGFSLIALAGVVLLH